MLFCVMAVSAEQWCSGGPRSNAHFLFCGYSVRRADFERSPFFNSLRSA